MLKKPKLIEGHYECRRFEETLPSSPTSSEWNSSDNVAIPNGL